MRRKPRSAAPARPTKRGPDWRKTRNSCLFSLPALFLLVHPAAAEPVGGENARFLGVQSCSSSSCHGGARTNFDQVLIWSRRDFHTRSYATLTTARSARLAEGLKLADPSQSPRCTVCHAPFQEIPSTAMAAGVRVSDGVSCEHCHGPAGPWIRTHTRPDLSHAEKVAAGLRDLRGFYDRANACVACHQNVEPELLEAGHPELIFELDGQSVTEPRHWREREAGYGPALWLTGQAVALREMSWALSRQAQPREKDLERWSALRWLLSGFGLGNARPDAFEGPAASEFGHARQAADRLARQAAGERWSNERIGTELRRLAALDPEFRDTRVSTAVLARRAERLVLALDRLVMAGPPDLAARVNEPINELFRAVQSVPDFNPALFAGRLAALERQLQ